MNKKWILSVVVIAFTALAVEMLGGSIWAKRNKEPASLHDDVARHIGDVLTIKISEEAVDNKAKRDLQKQTHRPPILTAVSPTLRHEPRLSGIPGFTMDAQSENSLNSKADYKDERKYTDSVTVVVMDIMPNRNLVSRRPGSRHRRDIQMIEVSGCRPATSALTTPSGAAGGQFQTRDQEQGSRPPTKARLARPDLQRPVAVLG